WAARCRSRTAEAKPTTTRGRQADRREGNQESLGDPATGVAILAGRRGELERGLRVGAVVRDADLHRRPATPWDHAAVAPLDLDRHGGVGCRGARSREPERGGCQRNTEQSLEGHAHHSRPAEPASRPCWTSTDGV